MFWKAQAAPLAGQGSTGKNLVPSKPSWKRDRYRHNLSLAHPHALQWLQSSLALYHSPLQLETVQHCQGALMESDVRYKNLRAAGNLSSQAAVINYLISVCLNQLLQSCFAGQCTSNFSLGLMSFISTAEFPFGLQKLLLSPVMLFDIMACTWRNTALNRSSVFLVWFAP